MNQIFLRRFCTGLGIAFAGCTALHTQAWADGPEIPVAPPVPEFTIKPVTTRPCLLIDSAGVPAFKARYEAIPHASKPGERGMDGPIQGLLYGDDAYKKKFSEQWMADIRKQFNVRAGVPLPPYRRYSAALYIYDIVASFGYLSEADKKEFRDLMVRGANHYVGDDPSNFPSPATPKNNGIEYPKGFATGNRWTDDFLVAGLCGLDFPDLPISHAWVNYAVEQTQWQLDHSVWAGGAWSEVPRYHNWTMLLYSGWFDALKRRTGIDFYKDPHTKQLLDWYVRFSSSLVRFPDTTKDSPRGEPTLPAWGDSNYGPSFQVCAMFAPAYAQSDPAFSRRLMWMWRRAGSPFQHGWHFDTCYPLMVDPALPDQAQDLGSAFCREPGYVLMRSGFDTPDETVLTIRGGVTGSHRRNDCGSIDLFSDGIPLALGAQSGPYHDPEIWWNRSPESNNDVAFVGAKQLQTDPGATPKAFFTSATVDYFVTECARPESRFVKAEDAFKWVRHVLLAKQPDYVVVWDQCTSPMPSKYFLHTTASKIEWDKNKITSHTDYGADLDIHVLLPTVPLVPNEKEGPFGGWFYADPPHGKEDPYPFLTLKYITLDAAPNADFVTVLDPRKSNAPALTATLLSAGKEKVVIQTVLADHTDVVTLGQDAGSFQRQGSEPVLLPMKVDGNAEPGARFNP
jgi:hypothetical protein